MLKENQKGSTDAAALTKGCAGYAVAAETSKEAPQEVVVKDFKSSEILNTHRPSLAAVKPNLPDQSLLIAALGLKQNHSPEP